MHLVVGRIIRPHGIRGEVIVDVRTDDPRDRFQPGVRLLAGTARGPGFAPVDGASDGRWVVPDELEIESLREHQGRLIVVFAGVIDRNQADDLRGVLLWFDATGVPAPADPDEFHDHQLIGLRAVTPSGDELGTVTRIEHAPASDLLVLRRSDGQQALVPFVKAIVPEVDVPGGRVLVTPPDGLFDL
ncbi:ribosome maturation factor RimM [Pilimelia columellifera]|uniref:Ribosome maturation factor RimM n=1 Tax=Pilimelia columellifera subsp. columellifera TaxID=706583 RepID=A0ABP6AFL9_9ACTN